MGFWRWGSPQASRSSSPLPAARTPAPRASGSWDQGICEIDKEKKTSEVNTSDRWEEVEPEEVH